MADENFKRRLPFLFLEELKKKFILKYADQIKTAIAFAMNEDFQNTIKLKMEHYNNNPETEDSVIRVKNQLDNVKDVMVTNIEKVLERGEKIELLVDRTDRLNQQAFRFEKKSKKLKQSVQWANCKKYIFIGILLLIVLYCIISSFCGFDLSYCRSRPNYDNESNEKILTTISKTVNNLFKSSNSTNSNSTSIPIYYQSIN